MVLYIWILNIFQSSTAQNCLAYSFSSAMALVALLFLSLLMFSFSTKNTTLTQAQCLPDQRHALIQLKQGFKTTELHSWNASADCCIWDGITCDERTGMVTALNLADRSISGEINPALFNLSSLRYLNLAENVFDNLILPQTGFERFTNLTHLDLSYSGFSSQVPIGLSTLTNLISLNLSYYSLDLPTNYSNINTFYLQGTGLKTILSNLTKLQVLRLDGVNISLNGSEWGNAVIQVAPTLAVLSMSDCGLRGNLPDGIFQLTNLTELHLSYNSMLSGQLPYSIRNLQYLSILRLYNCSIYGEVPPSITNLTRLEYLNFGSNKLSGTIPVSLFSHPSLKSLYLSHNQLSGYLPEFSNGSSILEVINLGFNNIQGQLPISIFKSPKLDWIDLSSNNLNGTLSLDVIKHSKKLRSLNLSDNKLSIMEGKNHNESFYASFPQLEYLGLGLCNLTKFPHFLSYKTNIFALDLSSNSLTGEIPVSICNATLLFIDLSYNSLTGTIPPCLLEYKFREVLTVKSNKLSGPLPRNISQGCKFRTIDLSGNRINGSLPRSLLNCNSLAVLDLGNNQIVNRFPFWLRNLKNLRVLVLRSNQLYGAISDMEASTKTSNYVFPAVKVFDLSSNRFKGNIPQSLFENLKAMVTNSGSSTFMYMDSYYYYQDSITVISKGQIMEIENSLSIFSSLDLSQNEFSGEIPKEIGQLKSLDVLNLSHNALTGPIPSKFANLQQLQSLDLSFNQLSGPIPQELTSLTFLSALNLSYNNLVGEIPEDHQFSTFSNDSYLCNPGLCGSPLSMQCVEAPSNDGFSKRLPSKSSADIIGLSVSIGLGLGAGFVSVIWVLISWETGRKCFNFFVDRFYFWHIPWLILHLRMAIGREQ